MATWLKWRKIAT